MDVKDYLPIYLKEAYSQLEEIEMQIISVKSGNGSPEVYQILRRCAHTIKGSSAIMGLNTISELSRNLEFTFKNIAENNIAVNESLLSTITESTIVLRDEVDHVKDTASDGLPGTAVIMKKLESYAK